MRWVYERLAEEDCFKPVPEGWIFSIAGKSSYLVNDAQKADLLARLDRWRGISFVLLATILAPLLALSKALSQSGFPDWTFAAAFAISAVLLFKVAMPHVKAFVLRPVLASARPVTLPPMPTRVGQWDSTSVVIRRQAAIWSMRGVTLACMAFGWLTLESGHAALTSSGSYLDTGVMASVTAYFGAMLFMKLKGRRSRDRLGTEGRADRR